MKQKNIVLLLTILIPLFLFSFGNREFKLFYKTGDLQIESKFEPNCGCYIQTEYYRNGEVFKTSKRYVSKDSISTYLDGEDIIYFANGSIQIFHKWSNGAYDGRAFCNDSLGHLIYEQFYQDGFKVDNWRVYNNDRTIKVETKYDKNKTHWDSEKLFCTMTYFFKNKPVFEKRIENGILISSKVIDDNYYPQWVEVENQTGKKLFFANCGMCHSIKNDIVGPKLEKVSKIRNREWLYNMITDGDSLYKANDKIAVELYSKWNMTKHPSYKDLSKDEINKIIDYLDNPK